ncbi:MocR-like pyridoxine biosynthesis transcription factor PdxR [Flavobacterium geliluteum]|uniref:PLP-dependent aminotransferase family protein n=1 Tax=Flavobacterium geliluteum TaxID=2816120 RepID=A0A940XAV9_9FLAO|nr:PLP-dependent aminotransferase family protein [Flavobacterium geliluteum]MBP4139192.1 PLP-dependent aminotransferase family protein [Flavobacterium geliluteum]
MLRPWEFQIELNLSCEKALYIQIADAIIVAIKKGNLKQGDALPGSRTLSKIIGVNRNTLILAIDVLLAEGWLISKERVGIFVSENTFLENTFEKDIISKTEIINLKSKPNIIFDDGLPDTQIAPIKELSKSYKDIFNRKGKWQLMGYSNELGDEEFRNAICHMLNFKRGMNLTHDNVCITRGSQMAMYLTAHVLLDTDSYVLIENPGYKPAWDVFEKAGAKLLPLTIERDGLNIDEVHSYLKKYGFKIKAIYTTPHHQFPTTVTLSLAKRLELVELSNIWGFTIIEDDYDNEFHYANRPILPISSLENLNNYVYIGTFSKIIAPALRVGFIASSNNLINKVGNLRKVIDVQGDNIMEQALLQLIKDGDVKRHLKKSTAIYKNKRDEFDVLLKYYLEDKISYTKPEGGLAFWVIPNNGLKINSIYSNLIKRDVQIINPESFSYKETINGLRLGFGSLTKTSQEKGLKVLSEIL